MFRKIVLALAALAVVGTTAFAISATPAGAAPFNHHRHNAWRPAARFYGGPVNYGSCYVRRVIHTPFGPRVEWINRCY
jgi:hypothetical protein